MAIGGIANNVDEAPDDNMLLQAIRKRILKDIEEKQTASIINNVYGTGTVPPQNDIKGLMAGGGDGEDPFDYMVDIERRDLPELNAQGKPVGWSKKVRRYREKKE